MAVAAAIVAETARRPSAADVTGRSRVATYIFGFTEPFLAPIRRALPSGGTFDWSGFLAGAHPYFPGAEWGGMGRSGNGRELGPTGLAEYQEIKHVWTNTDPQPQGWFSGR